LAEGGGETTMQQLDGLPFISLDPFATYQEGVERSFAEAGISVHFVCETSSVLTAARLVELGIGCAFLDPFVADTIVGPKVVSCRVQPPIPHAYGVFAPAKRPLSSETERTLEMIRQVAQELT
jgi:DNA-binding transcriptional LysR family regulator